MRIPVRKGVLGSSFLCTGLARRTGQVWYILSSVPSSRTTTGSSTVYSPAGFTSLTRPRTSGGTRILWVKLNSGTVPRTMPPLTSSPGLTTGVQAHFFSRSRAWTTTPRVM